MKLSLLFIMLLIACTPVAQQATPTPEPTPLQSREVPMKLTTSDGYTLAYTYTPPFEPKGAPGAILLHQLNRNRHDYDQFAPRLADQGFGVITLDSRGHGESSGNWQDFSDADFKLLGTDIAAAKAFLKTQGIDTSKLVLIGASINANAAINYATTDADVKTLIAISPGIHHASACEHVACRGSRR
jgi:pimeloyl-ACP methyl ester carboxylesterase